MISKSNYIKGTQCQKLLWLTKHHPSVMDAPSDIQSFVFSNGHRVGEMAQRLFPDGHLLPYDLPFDQKLYQTKLKISEGKTIFEPSFLWNQLFCMVDILHYSENGWQLIEVKSSTSLQPTHIKDVAFQYYVLSNSGIKISACWVYHINTKYVRYDDLDLNQLFSKHDVTKDIQDMQQSIAKNEHSFKQVLKSKVEPPIPIGPHCTSPYTCSAKSYCWENVPSYSIFDIHGLSQKKKFDWFYQNRLSLDQFLPDDFSSFTQKLQLACHQESMDYINRQQLNQFLSFYDSSLSISFLDFESFQTPIPPFNDCVPYQQIPFQYSLHIQSKNELAHHDFLGDGITDPRHDFITTLINDIPSSGPIIVYNKQFESMILNDLKDLFPDLGDQIQGILNRLIDLMIPFKNKMIYFRNMKGTYSIKHVLPSLIPNLSYDDLSIGHGALASIEYQNFDSDRNNIENNLKDYCRMDTLAMVEILKALIELSKE